MTTILLDYAQPPESPKRRLIGWQEAAVLAAAGIFLPMLCFAGSLNRYPGGPDYQRGEWLDYLTLVPSVMASWPFAPLLFAATCALAVFLVAPHRVAQSWLLRWALYSGAILATQYTLIQAIAFTDPSAPLSVGTFIAICGAAIATLLALGALWIVPRVPDIKPIVWLLCAIVLPLATVVGWRFALPLILLTAMLGALVAPAVTLAVYLRVSFIVWKLAKHEPPTQGRKALTVPLVWLATYGAAWAVALICAVDLYNSLPKTPPDC
jgi:hypothetical protein